MFICCFNLNLCLYEYAGVYNVSCIISFKDDIFDKLVGSAVNIVGAGREDPGFDSH